MKLEDLKVPRLQIVWEKVEKSEEDKSPWGNEFSATYELVLYQGEESKSDIRANDKDGNPSTDPVKFEMSKTYCSGGKVPYNHDGSLSIPFRDGVHIMRDSIRLGNLPMYVVYGEKVEEIKQKLIEVNNQIINKHLTLPTE